MTFDGSGGEFEHGSSKRGRKSATPPSNDVAKNGACASPSSSTTTAPPSPPSGTFASSNGSPGARVTFTTSTWPSPPPPSSSRSFAIGSSPSRPSPVLMPAASKRGRTLVQGRVSALATPTTRHTSAMAAAMAAGRTAGAVASATPAVKPKPVGLARWGKAAAAVAVKLDYLLKPPADTDINGTSGSASFARASTYSQVTAAAGGASIPSAGNQATAFSSSTRENEADSAHANILSELFSATLTIDHNTPSQATSAGIEARKAFDALMDVDLPLKIDTDEMLSNALALKMGFLNLGDDGGQKDDDGRCPETIGAEAALARAIGAMKRDEANRARVMDVQEEIVIDWMDVEEEVAAIDKMEVDGEEDAKLQQEMRALLNEGRARRARARLSAVLSKTRGGGKASWDHSELRKKWKGGKLSSL